MDGETSKWIKSSNKSIMIVAKYFGGCCVVFVSVIFSWALLIGACSLNRAAPVQADKPIANSQNPVTPAQADNHKPGAMGKGDCSKSEELLEWQRTSLKIKEDRLYLYAVKLFNQPIACKEEIKDEGTKILVFTFANGPTFRIERNTDSFSCRLRSAEGFPDEEMSRSIIKRYSEEHLKGISKIDWANPEEAPVNDNEDDFIYWAPKEDINAAAHMTYKDKKLVEISYHGDFLKGVALGDDWEGEYEYVFSGATAAHPITITYTIQITNPNASMGGKIISDGYQTYVRINCDAKTKGQEPARSYSSSYENGGVSVPVVYLNLAPSQSILRDNVQPPSLFIVVGILGFIASFPLSSYFGLRAHRRLTRIRDEATHLIEGVINLEFNGGQGTRSYGYSAVSPLTGKTIGDFVRIGLLSPNFGRICKGSTVAILYRDDKRHALL